MKKILMAVFAILMTAAWVVPAMAVDTTFYGTYRVRLFGTNNALDYSNDGAKTYTGVGSATDTAANYVTDNNSWIDQRFRLGVESKASDQLRGFVQLEIGDNNLNRSDTWGTNGDAANGVNNQHVTARQAYLSFNAGPVRVKAGRQIFGDAPDGGQSFRVSDDGVYYGLLDGGLIVVAQVDGFVFATKVLDPLVLAAAYVKLSEASSSSITLGASDKDNDLYVLEGVIAPSDAITAAAYFLYDRDRTTVDPAAGTGQNSPWWLGAGVSAKFDRISLKVNAAYKGVKYEKGCQPGSCGIAATGAATDLKYSAYALDADVSANFGPATVGFAAGMGSGDGSETNTTDKDFTAVAGSYGNQLGGRPAIFFDSGEVSNGGAALNTTYANGISNSTLTNVTFIDLYASFKATDDLTLSGLVAKFWHTEKSRVDCATDDNTCTNKNTWESALGTELDLNAVYKLYPQLALVAQAAWFMPDEGIRTYTNTASNNAAGSYATDDNVSEYFAKIQYDF